MKILPRDARIHRLPTQPAGNSVAFASGAGPVLRQVQKQQTKKINERLQNVAAATSCAASSYTGSSCRTQKLQLPNKRQNPGAYSKMAPNEAKSAGCTARSKAAGRIAQSRAH